MPRLQYGYFAFPGDPTPRPMVLAVAINTLNGREQGFLGLLDTGADSITLTSDLLVNLGIDPLTLSDMSVGGVHGVAIAKHCDYIRIALVETTAARHHFPNGKDPVPLHFSEGSPFCLLGRESFLDLCEINFDGLKKTVTITF